MNIIMISSRKSKYSIDEWVNEFAEIYGLVDIQRTPSDIWLLLMEDASKVAKNIRKEQYAESLNALAHVFCWTCAIVWRFMQPDLAESRTKTPLSIMIWNKYPIKSPDCGKEKCICPIRRDELENLPKKKKKELETKIEKELAIDRARHEKIPRTLDEFTDMFNTIYSGAHYPTPIENIAFHFMEEVGEVSSCIRDLREMSHTKQVRKASKLIKNLEREIADIVSWTISLLLKIDYILGAGNKFHQIYHLNKKRIIRKQTANLHLSDIIWNAFQTPDGKSLQCPVCGERPCKCIPISF